MTGLQTEKYFLIESNYVGPNPDQYLDCHLITIQTRPERGNSGDNPEIIDGWCGTTNDWSVNAHGVYDTLAAARAAIRDLFGPCRGCEVDDDDEYIVEQYLVGQFVPIDSDWALEGDDYENEITAQSTDADLDKLFDEAEADANSEGYTLKESDLWDRLAEIREDKKTDAA